MYSTPCRKEPRPVSRRAGGSENGRAAVPAEAQHGRAPRSRRPAGARAARQQGTAPTPQIARLCLDLVPAPLGVLVPLVATVDDQVSLLQELHQLVDRLVHGRAGLDQDDDLARPLERCDEVLDLLEAPGAEQWRAEGDLNGGVQGGRKQRGRAARLSLLPRFSFWARLTAASVFSYDRL